MAKGRPVVAIELSAEERSYLESQVRRRKVDKGLAERCAIVLGCAAGRNTKEVARAVGVCAHTVGKWRRRFAEARLDGLFDEPRLGRPRTISDEQVAEVVSLTLEHTPKDATHWSKRSMAARVGLSATTIGRIWGAFGLQPHRVETFKLSSDPQFVDKVQDIVGLYMAPPERAVVLSLDEKSQIQALDRSQPILPLAPGVAERRSHDYKRNGTLSLFAALDVATGFVLGQCYKRHRAREFKRFLNQVDRAVPPEFEVHIVMDNYATHKTKLIRDWFAKRPRYHLHFTPTSASWLNLIERWFALLSEKKIKRGAHSSVAELEADIRSFIEAHNDDPKPFIWTKPADDILQSVKRFCLKVQSQHSPTIEAN